MANSLLLVCLILSLFYRDPFIFYVTLGSNLFLFPLLYFCYRFKNPISLKKIFSKDEVFFGILHELKTHIAVIRSQCEVALLKKRSVEKYIDTLQCNIKHTEEISRIIKTLMNIKNESRRKNKINIQKLLKEISNDFILLNKGEKKRLICDFSYANVVLNTNETLLRIILQNFLQNAFKFSPNNGKILFCAKILKNRLNISISDEGSGMLGNKNRFFYSFEKAGNKEGIGLGLYLVKVIAREINAEICLKKRENANGTTALLTLRME